LGVKIPDREKFWYLGDLTSLWMDEQKRFWRLNYERGPLLYALVAKYRPTNVLEFGTGGGFSTLCMAWAMSDFGINGKIFTIDRYSIDSKFERPINYDGVFSPRVESLSLRELWKKAAQPDWLKHVEPITGYSGEAIAHAKLPKIQFAYVDGAHHYEAVKHDFYSTLNLVDGEFGILFDDCMKRPLYGVKEFIESEVAKNFDAVLIETDKERIFEKLNIPTDPEYGMCWIHSDSLGGSLKSLYPQSDYREFLKKHRRYESLVLKRREKLNSIIPILAKIKFRWWIK
jgi:hypothetical protein